MLSESTTTRLPQLGILNCTIKGPVPLQRGDDYKNGKKFGEVIEKVSSQNPLS
jgi:hypothetical protein